MASELTHLGHVTTLFMEFQHKGNKHTKKGEFSAKPCGFLGRNTFRKLNCLNATQNRKNNNWTDLSLLGQEPTFKGCKTTLLPVLVIENY